MMCLYRALFLGTVLATGAVRAAVWHVAPNLAAEGDGTSWSSPVSFTNVVTKLQANDVILAKAGTYAYGKAIAFTKSAEVRGGYAGTDDVTLAANPYSVLDGCDTVDNIMSYSGTLNVYNLEFTRAATHGLFNSSNNQHLRAYDCRFTDNGTQISSSWGNGNGRALCCYGAAVYLGGSCIISNCFFAGNAQVKTGSDQSGGGAVDIHGITWAKIYDSTFVTNGVAWSYPAGSDSFAWGSGAGVIQAMSTPTTIIGCKFVANRIASNQSWTGYATPLVILGEEFGETSRSLVAPYDMTVCVSNCLFVGNESVAKSTDKMGHVATAPIFVRDTLGVATCRVDNCTFAYNNFDTTVGSAGISLHSGTARIRNCIFFGNRIAQSGTQGCDLKTTGTSGIIDVDYSMFADTGTSNIFAAAGTTIQVGSHNVTGDPLFVTPFSDIAALLTVNGALRYFIPDDATLAALLAVDVHVANKASRAIDAGDPAYSCALEPTPNGGRINLGRYGGTAEACTRAVSQPEFVGEVTLTLPYDTTQPHIAFALGGNPDAAYSATVRIEACTNGVDYFTVEVLEGCINGDAVDKDLSIAFTSGGTLTMRVTITSFGAEGREESASVPLDKPMPPSYGKGGGEGVLHVRPGATGDGSGSDWFNAVASAKDMASAARFLTADEIWMAGTNLVTVSADAIGLKNKTVRGGFAGTENSIGERTAGVYTVLDGEDRDVILFDASCDGNTVFERIEFARGGSRGLTCTYSTANSSATFNNCRFVGNGKKRPGNWTNSGARGLAVTGNATSTLTMNDCYFADNATAATSGQEGDGAVVLSTLKRACFNDCDFIANGVVWTNTAGSANTLNGNGEAALTAYVPTTLIGCRFVGNRVGAMWAGYDYRSAIVYFSSTGNAVTNCLFLGNESVTAGTRDSAAGYAGVMLLGTDAATEIENCTFAYNMQSVTAAAAALTIRGGSAKVRNSIFYGNKQYPGTEMGADIWLNKTHGGSAGKAATLDIDYTMFASVDEGHLLADDGCTISTNEASHLYAADPQFVSSLADFEALLSRPNNKGWAFDATKVTFAQAAALNVHLRSRAGYTDEKTGELVTTTGKSPAIDAGDPGSDYSKEPTRAGVGTNGKRVNLGCYGNTPWASLTARSGLVLFVR